MKNTFIILSLFIGVILIVGCVNQVPEKDEIEGLKDIIPFGWTLTELPVDEISENEIAIFRITSTTECTGEFMKKPEGKVIETINPFVVVTYENKWNKEDYDKENRRYEDCLQDKSVALRAMACVKREPTINTKSYAIFITGKECDDETSELKNIILKYFKKFK